jgi:hypothetical protein
MSKNFVLSSSESYLVKIAGPRQLEEAVIWLETTPWIRKLGITSQ